jgi:hypothetical protein
VHDREKINLLRTDKRVAETDRKQRTPTQTIVKHTASPAPVTATIARTGKTTTKLAHCDNMIRSAKKTLTCKLAAFKRQNCVRILFDAK